MTLDLVLKYEWYDMIASGEKREEYRDVGTWAHRLLWWMRQGTTYTRFRKKELEKYLSFFPEYDSVEFIKNELRFQIFDFRPYDTVRFHRGYTSTTMEFKIEDITIGRGKPEWGAPDYETFIIKLGERL